MKKIILSIGAGVLLVITLVVFMLINVKLKFNRHLEVTYPDNHFYVQGLPKIDFLSGSYYSQVFCLDDSRTFTISKYWNTKQISDNINK